MAIMIAMALKAIRILMTVMIASALRTAVIAMVVMTVVIINEMIVECKRCSGCNNGFKCCNRLN